MSDLTALIADVRRLHVFDDWCPVYCFHCSERLPCLPLKLADAAEMFQAQFSSDPVVAFADHPLMDRVQELSAENATLRKDRDDARAEIAWLRDILTEHGL